MNQGNQAFENARKPFRRANLITALGLGAFAFATFAYSVYRVHEDTFEDVVMTPELEKKIAEDRDLSKKN
ncbi:cytochrome c oxidase assembly protein Coa3 [Schizosaccharomyces pombe]|uniref:Cytochrome c oxidase assembly factor 3, mitochondrial n=1 Tax=Schizosaccharomyces pombe (strain 972 / ATCC 24843) TaxID=284812 RepID=COA3_SCHPO|nr:protein tam3 [Schizosaccharomyces pombe]G2TRJ9.1 RecName: Full=Cytochrome c oxidase assembly factor 3, mitochondrial; AltName: Full=Transcripts altered in meiosis protein 3 [Schizosaccharomyces pombe 972h-]CCD31342.1 mitochondrial conserved protein [Schizosaccharomyces pombe]|eukprot:NP_001343132.1 protein tam3 [Schizosaccharomyces pombe]